MKLFRNILTVKNCVRNIHATRSLDKIIPDNLKGKSKSSQDWLYRQLNDEYVIKSRYHGYRCRSAFKLLEIDEKYKILKPGLSVIECGAAPGSWTQVIVNKLKLDQDIENTARKGLVIAVDLQKMEPIKGAIILKESNFTDPSVQEKILKLLPNGKADVILSDMAPKATGSHDLDCPAIMSLNLSVLQLSVKILNKDGTFLCKAWDNNQIGDMMDTLQNLFTFVKRVKPKASRADSSETYLLAKGYLKPSL